MRFRAKDPARIADDALVMAQRKEAEGCTNCAAAYRTLAVDRRHLLARAGALAGAGLALSLVDVGGLANGAFAASSLGSSLTGFPSGFLGSGAAGHAAGVAAVEASAAYKQALADMQRRGIALGDAGGLIGTLVEYILVRELTDGRAGQLVVRLKKGGISSSLIQLDRGGSLRLHVGTGHDASGAQLATIEESIAAQLPLVTIPGRLLPLSGARIIEPQVLPSSVPPASADTINCIGCIAQTTFICMQTPDLFCRRFGGTICNIVVTIGCSVAAFYACAQVGC